MKEIQRYDIVGNDWDKVEHPDGGNVDYDDHLAAIEEARKQERESMRCESCKYIYHVRDASDEAYPACKKFRMDIPEGFKGCCSHERKFK